MTAMTNLRRLQLGFKLIGFFAIVLFLFVGRAMAHPADTYAHAIHVTFAPDEVRVSWEIKPGAMLTSYLWYKADKNQDDVLSQAESDQWAHDLASNLIISFNGIPANLEIQSIEVPASLQGFQSGKEFITIHLFVKLTQDVHQVVITNLLEPGTSINWFNLVAEKNASFRLPTQQGNSIAIELFQNRSTETAQSDLITSWNSSSLSIPAGQKKDLVTTTAEKIAPGFFAKAPREILLDAVRSGDFSPSFYAFAIGISIIIGALHALTPGHGKTIVAAYLVGSRGTWWHAVVLGAVVTITHTGSVFALGLLTLTASRYFFAADVVPFIELLSGMLIVFLGGGLLFSRFKEWRGIRRLDDIQLEFIPLGQAGAKKRLSINQPVVENAPPHTHEGMIPRMPQVGNPLGQLSLRSLVALGVGGGLVPCPDAIAILLVAVAINRIVLGLSLILAFSLGLAVVLILVGMLMVGSRRLFTRITLLNRLSPVMPLVSAGIVLILGGLLSSQAISKFSARTADADPKFADIMYLAEDKENNKQIFVSSLDARPPKKLTNAQNGVVEFSISPDHLQVIFIQQTEDFEYEIRLISSEGLGERMVFACQQAACSQPIWSPTGDYVVFEYMPLDSVSSSLWWLDTASGAVKPLFQDSRVPGANLRWSPDGSWLSYSTPDGIVLSNLERDENRKIPNVLGAGVHWAPDGNSILVRDVVLKDGKFVTQLYEYNLQTQSIHTLVPDEKYENILASWSPDGTQIALVRRDLFTERGDQIWLMNADGGNIHAVTNVNSALHGSLNWSLDGRYILYDLYPLDVQPLSARLEVLDTTTGKITNLGLAGYSPVWIYP